MKYIRLLLLFWAGCVVNLIAQNITVKGTVLDDLNEPLISVTVHQVGVATNGVVTDLDGNYTISVPANSKLQFTYIGFKTAFEAVNNRTLINVKLEPDSYGLEEIVFLGYSGQKKSELSSSIVSIDGEKLKDVTTNDVGGMLQGRIAGVQISNASGQPGDAAKIRIRGTHSMMAGADPLYVVDGIPGGSFNHNDIETITVLKDAAATALYGSEGSNGVIVVTTKKAQRNQPTQINFKATYGRTEAVKGKLKMMSGAELYDVHNDVRFYGGSQSELDTAMPSYLRGTNYDWYKAAFDAGNVQDYYLSVSGASQETTYMISTNYYKQDGTLINTGYDQISTRLNLSTKLYHNVDMNLRLHYEKGDKDQSSSYVTGEGAYRNIPWDVPNDKNFNILKIDSDVRPDNGLPWYTQDRRNFLYNEQYNFANNKSSRLNADLQLNWNITDWLMFTTNNRYGTSSYTYSRYLDPRTSDPSKPFGYFGKNIGESSGWTTSNLLRLNKDIDNVHSFGVILGFETGRSSSRYTSAHVQGTSEEPMIPGKATLKGPSFDANETDSYNYQTIGWSVFGQLQYNYLSRYFFTASLRADASSRFAKDKRVGTFPAVSGAWLVSNEEFFPKNEVLSFLKFRASYGVTGNSGIPVHNDIRTYQISGGNTVGEINPANTKLAWESAHMSTVGFDFRFFNRLDLNVDLYQIDNKNLLKWVYPSPTIGYEKRLENAGDMRNRGLEIQLSSDNIVTKDFYWNTTFNIGFNKNEIKNLDKPRPDSKGGTLAHLHQNGYDINTWYGKKWLGVDYETGSPLWERIVYDDSGNEIAREATTLIEDEKYGATNQTLGKATPKFTGGLTNSLKYKGVGLDVSANFVYGNKIYNRDREYTDADGAYFMKYNMQRLHGNWSRWEKPGDVATHPRFERNGNMESNKSSSRYLEDGSFFRIKNITLSYDLPSDWLRVVKMRSCRVFVSGDNPFTFTNFSGIDPEVDLETTEYRLAGMYSYSYPISRQILFGVDIKF